MTFEVEADEEAPSLDWLISDATNGIIQCSDARALQGYAAYGRSIGSAIEPVTECFNVELFDDGETLRSASGSIFSIIDDELGCTADQAQASRMRREQVATRQLPAVLRLTYYDASRDFQTSEARASAGETDAGTEVQRELPAVIDAGQAKALAQEMISRDWLERDVLTLRLPPHRIALEPGSRLTLPLGPNLWTVQKVVVDGMAVIVTVKPCGGAVGSVAADGGRVAPNSDLIGGEVSIALLDIPALSPNNPTLLLAASSPAAAWKRVPVEVVFAGQNMTVLTSARKSLLGSALTVLPPADPSVIDTVNSIDVQMVDPDQWLTSCDDEALAAGANLALVGHELLQFADATPLGGGRFRLARLLRGRAGTEGAIPDHAAGEIVCVVDTGTLQSITLPVSAIGREVTAQTAGSSASLIVSPRADAIASPSGGATVDEEARSSIDLILATLRQHGLIDV